MNKDKKVTISTMFAATSQSQLSPILARIIGIVETLSLSFYPSPLDSILNTLPLNEITSSSAPDLPYNSQ